MPTQANEIVALPFLRKQLGLAEDSDSQDDILTAYLDEAVSFVSRETGRPLLDVTDDIYVTSQNDKHILIECRYVKSVDRIRYWTLAGALRSEPDGTIEMDTLGRFHPMTNRSLLWPPEAGWPDLLSGTCMEVRLTRGFDLDVQSKVLRAAVILVVRQLFDGYEQIRPTTAFYALIRQWRRR